MRELDISWKIPEIAVRIGDIAEKNNISAWLVGGWIRDALLGIESQDLDIVVEAENGGDILATLVAKALKLPEPGHYRRTGAALLKYKNFSIEFTGTRKSSYSEDGKRDNNFGLFKEDIMCRDFTINALACHLPSGRIVDETKNGLADLKEGLIDTPCDPEITFNDDPLRIMRAARFACLLDLEISPRIFDVSPKIAKDLLGKKVAPERIGIELVNILKSPDPSQGLDLCQRLGINKYILPEIWNLANLEQNPDYHHKDVYQHTLDVLERVANKTQDPIIRLAALLHDIGKYKTRCLKKTRGQIRWTFHNHDVVGARMAKSIIRRLKLASALQVEQSRLEERLFTIIRYHLSHLEAPQWADSAVRRFIHRVGDSLEDLLIVMECDIVGHKNPQTKGFTALKKRIDQVNLSDLTEAKIKPAIAGEALMAKFNRPPGPWIGIIHKALKQAVIDGEIPPNSEDEAWSLVKNLFNAQGDIVGQTGKKT